MMNATLEKAWSLRWGQRIEECMLLIPSLRDESTSLERDLLVASIHRSQGKIEECLSLHEQIRSRAFKDGLPLPPRAYFEFGIMKFMAGDFLLALEDFIQFKDRIDASSALYPIEKSIALGNILLCLENLSLPFSLTHEELKRTLDGLSENPVDPIPALQAQLLAFEYRQLFRQGKVSEILDRETARQGTSEDGRRKVDQAFFYALWLRSLPFLNLKDSSDPLELLKGGSFFFMRSYRVATLYGRDPAKDQSGVKVGEKVSRLYLWTWKWLMQPENSQSGEIGALIKEIITDSALKNLSVEEAMQLRNALMWLSIADPTIEDVLNVTLDVVRIPASGQSWSILDLEYRTLKVLQSWLAGSAIQAREVQAHPGSADASVLFAALLVDLESSTDAGKLSPLASFLRATRQKRNEPLPNLKTINLETFELRSDETKVRSESLAKAIDLLFRKKDVPVAEFAGAAFGIWKFETEIHQTKVFNLIARMKAFCWPEVRFHTKSGRIFAEGQFEQFRFKRPEGFVEALRSEGSLASVRPAASISGTAKKKERQVRSSFAGLAEWSNRGHKEFTRSDVAELLGGSRCTVIRRIDAWVKQGKLSRMGRARATRYRINSNYSKGA